MNLVKLTEYQELRRGEKSRCGLSYLRRQAKNGAIPGAFQMDQRGDWWVDLDTHDEIIRERINMQMVAISGEQKTASNQDDDDIVVNQILEELGLCRRVTG